MGQAGREAVPKAAIQAGTAVARIDPELDEIRYGGKISDGRSVIDINGLHGSLPAKFKVRVMEDNQATIIIFLIGSSSTMRHTERTQKVSFAWLRQQFEFGNFLMLNADTREYMADIFIKTFIDRSKWQHALRLIARNDAFRTSKVARGNPKPTENAATPAKESTPASEELANSLLKSKDFLPMTRWRSFYSPYLQRENPYFEQCSGVTNVRNIWYLTLLRMVLFVESRIVLCSIQYASNISTSFWSNIYPKL